MRYRVEAVSDDERPPGKVIRVMTVTADDPEAALNEAIRRIGMYAYGARFSWTELAEPVPS